MKKKDDYKLHKPVEPEARGILCNTPIPKRKWLYFQRGDMGSGNAGCGTNRKRVKLKEVTWERANKECDNGKIMYMMTKKN